MTFQNMIDELQVPPRTSNHRGEWVPLYIDLLPGSGERLCIGVVAADASGVRTMPVPGLERLQCAYGAAAQSVVWSAKLAMIEALAVATRHGLDGLGTALANIEGLTAGTLRTGAGRNLDDVALLGLRQSSTLVACEEVEESPATVPEAERASPLARAVQRAVVAIRPQLRENFRRHFSLSSLARPTTYGFVGHRLVANFASLGGVSADALGPQIDRAKARLWDLEQLQEGVLRDIFGEPLRNCAFELLACPPPIPTKAQFPKRPLSVGQLKEAENTLEREADKFRIRWRVFRDAKAVAGAILEREAA